MRKFRIVILIAAVVISGFGFFFSPSKVLAWHGELSVSYSCLPDGSTSYSVTASSNWTPFSVAWQGALTQGTLSPGTSVSGSGLMTWPGAPGESQELTWTATAQDCPLPEPPATQPEPDESKKAVVTPEPPWGPSWPTCGWREEDVHPSLLEDWLWRCQQPVQDIVIPSGATGVPTSWDLPIQGVASSYFEVPSRNFKSEIRDAEVRKDNSVNPIGSSTAVWANGDFTIAFIHQLVAPWLPEMVGQEAMFADKPIRFVESSEPLTRDEATIYITDRPGMIHFYTCYGKKVVVLSAMSSQ